MALDVECDDAREFFPFSLDTHIDQCLRALFYRANQGNIALI